MSESVGKPLTGLPVQARDPLVVQIHQLPGDGVLVHVSGGLDGSTAVDLERRLLAAIRPGNSPAPQILLDLSRVTYLDHAGLDALLLLQDRVRVASGSIELLAPSPSVVRLLHEAELDGQSHMTIGLDDRRLD